MAEAEVKIIGDEGKENDEKVDSGPVVEDVGPPSIESVVKPIVEEFTQAEKSLVENVTQSSSTYVTEVKREIENLVSDQWASLKNLAPLAREDTLPTSDKTVGESNKSTSAETKEEEEACVDETSRSTHPQPFAAVAATSATSPASWMNCCGLLDVLRPSDK